MSSIFSVEQEVRLSAKIEDGAGGTGSLRKNKYERVLQESEKKNNQQKMNLKNKRSCSPKNINPIYLFIPIYFLI